MFYHKLTIFNSTLFLNICSKFQVHGNYGETYTESTKEERQEALEKKHHMTCKCIACEEDWPLLEDLASFEVKIFSYNV